MDTEVENPADEPVAPLVEINVTNGKPQETQLEAHTPNNGEKTEKVIEKTTSAEKQPIVLPDVTVPDITALDVTAPDVIGESKEINEVTSQNVDEHGAVQTVEDKPEAKTQDEETNNTKKVRAIHFTDSDIDNKSDQDLKVASPVKVETDAVVDTSNVTTSSPNRHSRETTLEFEDTDIIEIEKDTSALSNTGDSSLDHFHISDSDSNDDFVYPSKSSAEPNSIQEKYDFIQNFRIPSLTRFLEEYQEEDDEVEDLRVSYGSTGDSKAKIEDEGLFVDPTMGSETPSMSSFEVSEESSVTLDLESYDDEPRRAAIDTVQFKKVVVSDQPDDVFDRFTKEVIGKGITFDAEDPKESRLMQLRKEALQVSIELIFDLFNFVIEEAEKINMDNLLKNKLDKEKMFEDLAENTETYMCEKEKNTFLNTRMSDYYRRLRNPRPFAKLNSAVFEREYTKYMQILSSLDFYLKLQADTKTKNALLLSSVSMDLAYVDHFMKRSEENLEAVMIGVFANKSEHLKRVVERELTYMRDKRNEISDTRLSLITKKHTLARINDKIYHLEHSNENVFMEDFISIQNQVTQMNTKIEERNYELKRLRINYRSELHNVSHNREMCLAISRKLKECKKKLKKKLETQRELRERLYKAKQERGRIRKENIDLRYQGGLLSLPALMLDYDATVEKIHSKQVVVNELKEVVNRLTKRLLELETRTV